MYDIVKIEQINELTNINMQNFMFHIDNIKKCKQDIIYIIFIKHKKDPYIISPIFLILLINLCKDYKEKKKNIFIDITQLNYKTQFVMLNHLKQYSDYQIITKNNKKEITNIDILNDTDNNANKYIVKESSYLFQYKIKLNYCTHYDYYEGLLPKLFNLAELETLTKQPSNKVLVYKNTKGNDVNINANDYDFLENKKVNINYLPIINISNLQTPDNFDTLDDKENNLKNLYLHTQINIQEKKYKVLNIWDRIFKIYLKIHMDDSTLNAFKTIITETVSNIQEHTDDKTNGHISFYKNTVTKQNEFYICDDYKNGFLETYLQKLKNEKENVINLLTNRLKKLQENYAENKKEIELLKKEQLIISKSDYNNINHDSPYNYIPIVKEYFDDIKTLEKNTEEDDILLLEKLFDYKKSTNMHKASRLIMHFGIPSLMKILTELNKQEAILTIYLHRGNRTYNIYYQNEKLKVTFLHDINIKGTYIHISFPIDSSTNNEPVTKQTLNIKSQAFNQYMKDSPKINKKIELLQNTNSILYYSSNNNISEFLRNIYQETFINNVKDIVIVNFPIKKYEEYLKILIDIIYKDNKIYSNDTLNIAFLDDTFPKAIFIGGKNKEELYSINYKLSESYNYNKENFTKYLSNEVKDVKVQSDLFYINNIKEQSFIPFELLLKNKTDEYIYTDMINQYLELEDNNEDIHLDTRHDFHLKKFYYFKHLFEDSTWVNRIAFDLAVRLENQKNIVLVGIETYSSSILSIVRSILNYKDDTYIDTFIINDLKEYDKKQFKSFKENHENKRFIIFCPVISDDLKINDLIKNIDYQIYCVVKLQHDNVKNNPKFNRLFTKDIQSIISNKLKSGFCEDCFGGRELPLYQIAKDRYNIKDIYVDNITQSKQNKILDVSWKNSIYFGHVERGSNHYLYYIKMNVFFQENINIIRDFCKKIKLSKDANLINVILSSNHNGNSAFITMIDKIVFQNNAIIHSFNIDNKEQNLHSLGYLKKKYQNNNQYKFYFVDDIISSGGTLEYFYNLLKHISNDKNVKFEKIFTLIDRTSKHDKKNILSSYYTKSDDFLAFKNLNIKPIKTGFEDCYLCQRKKYFKEMLAKSSLIFVKKQFKDKREKLDLKKASSIEYQEILPIDDFKNFLKVYALEYIYENIKDIQKYKDINKHIKQYTNNVINYFSRVYLNKNVIDVAYCNICTLEHMKFIKFETKIAFIKTMAFPKVLFIKEIRQIIHDYIIFSIQKEIKSYNKTSMIKPIFEDEDFKILDDISTIHELINYYKTSNKTSIDTINFLISTAGYLNINYIIFDEVVNFYYNLTLNIKNESNDTYNTYKTLLRVYPTAVKMLISYGDESYKEKAKYFNNSLKKHHNISYKSHFSRIFGLFVENVKYEDKCHFITTIKNIDSSDDIETMVSSFKNGLIAYIDSSNIKVADIEFYIDSEQNKNSPNLIDIFNNYDNTNDENITTLYTGGIIDKELSNRKNTVILKKNNKDDDYNIWCNYYNNGYTYIRISGDDELTSFGIVKIKHLQSEHLILSRKLLYIQNDIVKFFNNEFIPNIKEKNNKIKLENNIKEKTNIIENINHSYRKYNKYSEFLSNINDNDSIKDLISYSKGIELNSIIGSLNDHTFNSYEILNSKKETDKLKYYTLNDNLKGNDDLLNIIKNFMEVCPKYLESIKIKQTAKYTLNIIDNEEFYFEYYRGSAVNDELINAMWFELIFNAIKYNEFGSRIQIIIEKDCIYVENTGIKIENKNEIFDINNTSKNSKGLSIGLPYIKKCFNSFNIDISCIEPITKSFDCCFKIEKRTENDN
jgi:hypothetical protein